MHININTNKFHGAILIDLLNRIALWGYSKLHIILVFSNICNMGGKIGEMLSTRKETLAIAESCTGGLLSNYITNISGSSKYFLLSCVTYSNDSKNDILGVSSSTLNQYGAVHERTAIEMAQGIRKKSGSTYGLSTTGITGPGGGSLDKPIGTLCVGIATPYSAYGSCCHFKSTQRLINKVFFCRRALDILRQELDKQIVSDINN